MLIKILNTKLSKLKSPPFRGALISSSVMAFAGLGDAILYPVLPVYAEKLGIPIIWVGILLSANRFVRIILNTWVANIINSFGMKKVLLMSSCLAVVTTFTYGLNLGLASFFIARIIWGLSYSGLKIATLNYAAKVKTQSGLVFGLAQGIKSLGALVALWIGPVLFGLFGIEKSFFAFSCISIVAILLTFFLPKIRLNSVKVKLKKNVFPITN